MKKIKVAFFAEILIEDFDGASRTMFQLLNRIPRDQFEFQFYCGMPPKNDLGFEVVELPAFRIPFNSTYKAVFPHFSKGKMRQKLADFQPDIIHIASPSPLGNFASDYAQKHQIPIISIYHTHFITYIKYYFRKLPALLPFFYKKSVNMTRNFYKNIDRIYIPTPQIKEELQDICQLDGQNMQIWQRGIDQNLFNPNKLNKDYLFKITKNHHPTILFASRLVWEKNLKVLIELYNLCQEKKLPYNFVVAGDGVAREEVEKQMPNAHFTGMVSHEELAILYASSDIYVFPSDTESFGNVVIEAMASGVPCVVANGGGPKSLITDGENGFLCPTNDTAYYLEKIQLILNNPELRASIIEKGLTFVKPLSWDNLANIYFNDLREMAQYSSMETIF